MTLIERKGVSSQRARCCCRFSLLLTTSQPLPLNVGPPCHVSAEPRPSFFTVAPGRPCTSPAEPFSNRTSQKKGRKTFFARFPVSHVSASLFTPLSSSKVESYHSSTYRSNVVPQRVPAAVPQLVPAAVPHVIQAAVLHLVPAAVPQLVPAAEP